MVAQAGRKVVLKIGNAGSPTESFTAIGGVRLSQMEVEQSVHDTSHAGSGAWRSMLGGVGKRSVRLVADGVFEDSAAEEALRSVAFAGISRTMQLLFGNGDVVSGAFVVQRYVRGGEVGALEGFSVVLQSAGAVTFAAG